MSVPAAGDQQIIAPTFLFFQIINFVFFVLPICYICSNNST
ncbi:hypothetical protein D1BOALGB6SA_6684 [Olavius sp. associated proteobacterium Delta 1]|nr:hypothetical protein D1BOALGB6SA_6684 [Olavius sp. associated proteobacterium Delta 1]